MYVVTGGAGFIGSNMVAALEAAGRGPVVVCDRLRDGDKWRNIAKRELADIVHPDDLFEFLEVNGELVSAVIHMGAISATTETDVDKIVNNNLHLSMDLWDWCAQAGVRFIYASSAATYGDGTAGFVDDQTPEDLAKLQPLNPYGWSKHLFDRQVVRRVLNDEPAPPQWVGLKFFNVFGPNEYHKGSMQSVVAHIYPKATAGEVATLFKSHHPDFEDGGQTRDFIWVGDCISVMEWFLDTPQVSGLYNCGTGIGRTFKDLAVAVYNALDAEPKIDYVPTPETIRAKYQYFTQADTTRLRAAGYDKPFTSLEDGVTQYVQGYLNTPNPYR